MTWGDSPLPAGWAWARLDDVSDVQLGKMLDGKRQTGLHARPYLRNVNVQWDRIDSADVLSMDIAPRELERYTVQEGDLLLCEGGEPGRCAVVHERLAGLGFQKALHRIRPDPGVQVRYLAYVFRYLAESGLLDDHFTGSTIRHLPRERLVGIKIPIPPRDEQVRIIRLLDEQLSLVDESLATVATLRTRASITRDAARNEAVRQALVGTEGHTRSVGDIADVRGGIQKQPSRRVADGGGIPFLRVANVGRAFLNLSDVHKIQVKPEEMSRAMLARGDLLVVEGNGSPDQIGRAAMWDGSIDPCTHQNHLIRVRAGDDVDAEFLALIWNAPSTVAQLKEVASSSSGLYTLSTGKIKAIQLPVPAVSEQKAITSRGQALLHAANAVTASTDDLVARVRAFRRSLLSAAIAGRLTRQNAQDESAIELLRRLSDVREAAGPEIRAGRARKGTVTTPHRAMKESG